MIVGSLYWLTMPRAASGVMAASRDVPSSPNERRETGPQRAIEAACRERAEAVSSRLGSGCRVIVRAPFVLGGDLSEHQLERQHEEIIVPTVRALSTCYFDVKPFAPVTILTFATDESYERYARILDGRSRAVYSGYYQRSDRRMVLNASTGGGTLAHELTHALAHFDFPEMPEWFDEGLASLFEESVFSDDGLRIRGVSNWRLSYLLPALKQNKLPSLEAMMSSATVRDNQQALDYAYARYFCLYLQERELMSPYYRKYRANLACDPTGMATLKEILQADSLGDVDRDFRRWVSGLTPGEIRPGKT